MAKFDNNIDSLLQKQWFAAETGRISSENGQNLENIPKSDAKKAKMSDLLKKQQEYDRKMEKIARFKHFYGGRLPDKFRGLSDEAIANTLDDLERHRPNQFYNQSHGDLSGLQHDDAPQYYTTTVFRRDNPNVAFKKHKQKMKKEKVVSIFDELLNEREMKKALEED